MADLQVSLRLIWRARLPVIFMWLLIALAALVLLAAGFSARHPATIALDVGLTFIRFVLPLLVIILTQELIGREFERRYCLNSFTYPRPRHQWLLGRFAAIMVIALVFLGLAAAALGALVAYVESGYQQGTAVALGHHYVVTVAFVVLDLLVVGSVAMLLAVVAKTPALVLIGSFGFLLIARSYASVIELLRQGTDPLVDKLGGAAFYGESLPLLNFVMPDLGALDVRAIALYGRMDFLRPDWPWHVVGAFAYALAFLALSAYGLRRRQFG